MKNNGSTTLRMKRGKEAMKKRLEIEESLCVVVADVFYHLLDTRHF